MKIKLKIDHLSQTKREIENRVLDLLLGESGKIPKSWFVKQTKKEILEQIDVIDAVYDAYNAYHKRVNSK